MVHVAAKARLQSGYGCQPGGWVGNRIAEAAGLVRDRKDHEVISSRDNLVFHQMQTNHGRCLSLLEVAADSLAHVMLQLFQTVCLGKDRVAQGAGFIDRKSTRLNSSH